MVKVQNLIYPLWSNKDDMKSELHCTQIKSYWNTATFILLSSKQMSWIIIQRWFFMNQLHQICEKDSVTCKMSHSLCYSLQRMFAPKTSFILTLFFFFELYFFNSMCLLHHESWPHSFFHPLCICPLTLHSITNKAKFKRKKMKKI